MRLNNYISSSGICSRRKADELIEAGKVRVNSKPAKLGMSVDESDRVEVEGRLIKPKKNRIYIALNKPVGVVSTTERHIKGNIIDYINHKERIFPIGRLDKDSQGLILLTNDGSIVNEILREENDHSKEYIVTVDKPVNEEFIRKMSSGVKIYNPVKKNYTRTKPCEIVKIDEKTFKIILSQGLNRQIRRMCESFDYKVIKLSRIKIMDLSIKGIGYGKWRELTLNEVENLRKNNKAINQNKNYNKSKREENS